MGIRLQQHDGGKTGSFWQGGFALCFFGGRWHTRRGGLGAVCFVGGRWHQICTHMHNCLAFCGVAHMHNMCSMFFTSTHKALSMNILRTKTLSMSILHTKHNNVTLIYLSV